MAKDTLKILPNKIFKACLAIFQYYAWKAEYYLTLKSLRQNYEPVNTG